MKEVDPNSNDWSKIDYQIQMITGKSSLKIIRAIKYNDDPNDEVFKNIVRISKQMLPFMLPI